MNFHRFESSAAARAADQKKADEAVMSQGAKVSEQVATPVSNLICRNGKTVMPSSRRSSPQHRPTGSNTECTTAASRAYFMMSFRAK